MGRRGCAVSGQRWRTTTEPTDLSKRSLPNNLNRSEVIEAKLRSTEAEEGGLALAKLLQLALLALVRHRGVRRELALELDTPGARGGRGVSTGQHESAGTHRVLRSMAASTATL